MSEGKRKQCRRGVFYYAPRQCRDKLGRVVAPPVERRGAPAQAQAIYGGVRVSEATIATRDVDRLARRLYAVALDVSVGARTIAEMGNPTEALMLARLSRDIERAAEALSDYADNLRKAGTKTT